MKPSALKRSGAATLGLLLLCTLVGGCLSNSSREESAAQENREAPKAAPVSVASAPAPVDKGQPDLLGGIGQYENGNYKLATRQLQSALALGLDNRGQARAHKYLAFMNCVGGRQTQCRDEFRKALEADPAFDLTPAEAGHPTWGPVFRKLKASIKAGKK